MSKMPLRWTAKQLHSDAAKSAAAFRSERLAPTEAWKEHFTKSNQRFVALFKELGELAPGRISDEALTSAYKLNLGEAVRYLSGPPISDDDLKVLANVPSLAPGVLVRDKAKLRQVFSIIEKTIDPYRFPWVVEGRSPTKNEKAAALLASSVLIAAQRISTARRGYGKATQEALLKDFLRSLKYKEVPPAKISTIVDGPQRGEFCGESIAGGDKADVVLRLNDTRLMLIECKVSNSAVNSFKRINHEAAGKARKWLAYFGTAQVVTTAVIGGVFNINNLLRAQEDGLTLFWAHDLKKLGQFVASVERK
jgi:XamI restriction endonuclease